MYIWSIQLNIITFFIQSDSSLVTVGIEFPAHYVCFVLIVFFKVSFRTL